MATPIRSRLVSASDKTMSPAPQYSPEPPDESGLVMISPRPPNRILTVSEEIQRLEDRCEVLEIVNQKLSTKHESLMVLHECEVRLLKEESSKTLKDSASENERLAKENESLREQLDSKYKSGPMSVHLHRKISELENEISELRNTTS